MKQQGVDARRAQRFLDAIPSEERVPPDEAKRRFAVAMKCALLQPLSSEEEDCRRRIVKDWGRGEIG